VTLRYSPLQFRRLSFFHERLPAIKGSSSKSVIDIIQRELEKSTPWNAISNTLTNALMTQNLELTPELSESFVSFISETPLLTSHQKRYFLHCLAVRNATTYDVVFLSIELKYPFWPTTEKLLMLNRDNPTIEVADFMDFLNYFLEYTTDKETKAQVNSELVSKINTHFHVDEPETTRDNFKAFLETATSASTLLSGVAVQLTDALNLATHILHVQSVDDGVYIGVSPTLHPGYFWMMAKALMAHEPDKRLHILSLEASEENQRVGDRNYFSRFDWATPEELEIYLANHRSSVDSPVYWDTSTKFNTTALPIGVDRYHVMQPELPAPITLTHVTIWPDGDIPLSVGSQSNLAIASVILELARELNDKSITLYIHCKAGLGRTGVARIALRYAFRRLQNASHIPPHILLESYRHNHRYGVQTPDQFDYLCKLCTQIDHLIESEKKTIRLPTPPGSIRPSRPSSVTHRRADIVPNKTET